MSVQFSPYEKYFDKDGRPTGIGQQLFLRLNQLFAAQDANLALTNTTLVATNASLASTQTTLTDTNADIVTLSAELDALVTSKEAAASIVAGQVVRPNAGGKLVLAQADTVNNAKGAVVAATSANIGFTADLADGFLTLDDWTAATGAASLVTASQYFLSETTAGGITTTVPSIPGQVVLAIGFALDTKTLSLAEAAPMTL